MPRVCGQPGIVDSLDFRGLGEVFGDLARVLAMGAHSHGERLESSQHEPRVEWPGHAARRVLVEGCSLAQVFPVEHERASHDVGVSADVLGRAVNDDVRTQLEWTLQIGRCERVIDDEKRACIPGDLGHGADVSECEQRVARCLEPKHARGRREC